MTTKLRKGNRSAKHMQIHIM